LELEVQPVEEQAVGLFLNKHVPPPTRESASQFLSKAAEQCPGKSAQQLQLNNVALFQNSNVDLYQNK